MQRQLRKFGRVARPALAALAVLACEGSGALPPPMGLAHAMATRSCGAADGPTIAIYLKGSAINSPRIFEPYLQISIAGSINAAEGQSWRIPEQYDNWAAFRTGRTSSELASSGLVTVSAVKADSTLVGDVFLTFPSGREIRGGFHARWVTLSTFFLCG